MSKNAHFLKVSGSFSIGHLFSKGSSFSKEDSFSKGGSYSKGGSLSVGGPFSKWGSVAKGGSFTIRIRIYLLARRNLLWDILRLPSSRRAALGLCVILTL